MHQEVKLKEDVVTIKKGELGIWLQFWERRREAPFLVPEAQLVVYLRYPSSKVAS